MYVWPEGTPRVRFLQEEMQVYCTNEPECTGCKKEGGGLYELLDGGQEHGDVQCVRAYA